MPKSMSGTLITVAPTGAEVEKSRVKALPTTPGEIANSARECWQAGAAAVHVHARDHDDLPTLDVGRVKETLAAIREATDLIIQVSTGGAISDSFEDRLGVLDTGPDTASLTCGTVNFGDAVFENPWPLMVDLYRQMRDRCIGVEFEIFDLGHIDGMKRLLDTEGYPYNGRVHADLVMGVPGGMAGTPLNLVLAVQQLPTEATFSATGVGGTSVPVMLTALACGGHLRVGMEDTLTLPGGEKVTRNTQLVERAAAFASLAGRPPLCIEEARDLLSLPGPVTAR